MKCISVKTFEKFTGLSAKQFLPYDVGVEHLDEILVERITLADLVSKVAQDHYFDGSLGVTKSINNFHAICEDGTILPSPDPEYSFGSNYAHSKREEREGVALGDAWGEHLNHVKYVVEYVRDLNDWSGGEVTNEMRLTLFLVREDDEKRVKRIRRRVEDTLRKSGDPTIILRLATILGVKLD